MKAKKYIVAIIAIIVMVIFDQFTKWLVVMNLKDHDPIVLINDVFELRYLENRGAAFGIFQNQQIMFILMTAIIMVLVIALFIKLPSNNKRFLPMEIICVFIIGGAIGNLIDRVMNQYVVDFFYFKLIDFPIFNVADIYVTCAAFAFFILVIFVYKDEDFKFMKKDKA